MSCFSPYFIDVTTRMHDVDCNRRVSPAAMMRLFHVAADCQMRDQGLSLDAVRGDGKAMILSRLTLKFHKPAFQNETLRLETWPVPARGFVMERCYRAFCGQTCIAEGESAWALVDLATRRLLKSDQVDFSTFTHGDKLALEADIPPYRGSYTPVGVHCVGYSDTDLNFHMNNTRYIDMLCDFVPDMHTRAPQSFQIHYRNEAPMGSEISIERGQDANAFYFRTFCQGKVNVEAAILLADEPHPVL